MLNKERLEVGSEYAFKTAAKGTIRGRVLERIPNAFGVQYRVETKDNQKIFLSSNDMERILKVV